MKIYAVRGAAYASAMLPDFTETNPINGVKTALPTIAITSTEPLGHRFN